MNPLNLHLINEYYHFHHLLLVKLQESQNNQLTGEIGKKRDEFAKEHNIRSDKETVTRDITSKGENIAAQHNVRYQVDFSQCEIKIYAIKVRWAGH